MNVPIYTTNNIIKIYDYQIIADDNIFYCITAKELARKLPDIQKNYKNVTSGEVDKAPYKWIEGIVVKSNMPCTEARRIFSMGEQAYKQSLKSTTNDYLLDLDCRLSKIELGL